MATINVSTWTEFVTALGSHSSGDTIKLTADINCNDTIPTGVATTINCGSDTIIIDGNGHLIRNLRTSAASPVSVFSFSGTNHDVTIKDIDFGNLILDKPLFYFNASSTPVRFYMQNCRFAGRRSDYLIGLYDTTIQMTSCYFNLKFTGSDIDRLSLCTYESWADQIANYCIFVEYAAENCMSVSPSGAKPCCSAYPFSLNGCRIDGTLSVVYPWSMLITERYTYNAPVQNAIDAEMACRVDTSSDIQVYAPKGVWLKKAYLYSNPEITDYAFQNKNTSGTIPVTYSQLTDASYLASQGFDIIVPS